MLTPAPDRAVGGRRQGVADEAVASREGLRPLRPQAGQAVAGVHPEDAGAVAEDAPGVVRGQAVQLGEVLPAGAAHQAVEALAGHPQIAVPVHQGLVGPAQGEAPAGVDQPPLPRGVHLEQALGGGHEEARSAVGHQGLLVEADGQGRKLSGERFEAPGACTEPPEGRGRAQPQGPLPIHQQRLDGFGGDALPDPLGGPGARGIEVAHRPGAADPDAVGALGQGEGRARRPAGHRREGPRPHLPEEAGFGGHPEPSAPVLQQGVDPRLGHRLVRGEAVDAAVPVEQAEPRTGADPEAALWFRGEGAHPGRRQSFVQRPEPEGRAVELVGPALRSYPEETCGILGQGRDARMEQALLGTVGAEGHAPGARDPHGAQEGAGEKDAGQGSQGAEEAGHRHGYRGLHPNPGSCQCAGGCNHASFCDFRIPVARSKAIG